MKNSKNNHNAANKLSAHIAKSLNFDEMSKLENRYNEVVKDYSNTPQFQMLSTIRMDKLQSAKDWFAEIAQDKHLSIPFLVSKMLQGDMYALNIFDNVHKNTSDLIIDYKKIHADTALQKVFNSYGGSEDARAIVTAEHWLSSEEAVDLLGSNGKVELCGINNMLEVTNNFVEC